MSCQIKALATWWLQTRDCLYFLAAWVYPYGSMLYTSQQWEESIARWTLQSSIMEITSYHLCHTSQVLSTIKESGSKCHETGQSFQSLSGRALFQVHRQSSEQDRQILVLMANTKHNKNAIDTLVAFPYPVSLLIDNNFIYVRGGRERERFCCLRFYDELKGMWKLNYDIIKIIQT